MLRITPISTRHGALRLKVEGRLVGDWVAVLQLEIDRARTQGSELELDLAGVEFADSDGLSLLIERMKRGVSLVASSPFLTSLLESRGS